MPVIIDGKTFYRTGEALKQIGISRPTYFRWLKQNKIEDVKHKDRNQKRLFTEEDIEKIKKFVNIVNVA